MRTSPGSSSTSRTLRGRGTSSKSVVMGGNHRFSLVGLARNCELKSSTRSGRLREPDLAPVELHDLAAQRQPDPRPAVLITQMQTLEDGEDPFGVLGIDPD